MFTGIIETLGEVEAIELDGSNVHFTIKSTISSELKIDQSVAHNGVCLTVIEVKGGAHKVTAIEETLLKSNLSRCNVGDWMNLERCLKIGDRLDGHMVQGHVDTTAECIDVHETGGSWMFSFALNHKHNGLIVPKGSITINGVSLTVVEVNEREFKVAIIPYTKMHTTFNQLAHSSIVNIEFDILGKYVYQQLNRT